MLMKLVILESVRELINLGREKKNPSKQCNIREKQPSGFVEAKFKTSSHMHDCVHVQLMI